MKLQALQVQAWIPKFAVPVLNLQYEVVSKCENPPTKLMGVLLAKQNFQPKQGYEVLCKPCLVSQQDRSRSRDAEDFFWGGVGKGGSLDVFQKCLLRHPQAKSARSGTPSRRWLPKAQRLSVPWNPWSPNWAQARCVVKVATLSMGRCLQNP